MRKESWDRAKESWSGATAARPDAATAWLATALGRRCLHNEQRVVRQALDRVFGEQLLQIGAWGGREGFLRHARTQHETLVGLSCEARDADLIAAAEELPVTTDSIDAVLLPHTLELTPSPHALLREVDRVLRADGHLIVLGFVPGGPWGLRHLLARDGYPPGHRRMIREGRLRDWLTLLGLEVESVAPCCHTLPFEQIGRFGTLPRERWAERWLPFLAGSYLLRARKRVQGLTPIRPAWRRPEVRAAGGLVEPTTRASWPPTPKAGLRRAAGSPVEPTTNASRAPGILSGKWRRMRIERDGRDAVSRRMARQAGKWRCIPGRRNATGGASQA